MNLITCPDKTKLTLQHLNYADDADILSGKHKYHNITDEISMLYVYLCR
jgi:hypothetical protein